VFQALESTHTSFITMVRQGKCCNLDLAEAVCMNGDSLAICVFPPNRDLAEAVCMNGEIPLPYVCFPPTET
jgi:hypothetical protein